MALQKFGFWARVVALQKFRFWARARAGQRGPPVSGPGCGARGVRVGGPPVSGPPDRECQLPYNMQKKLIYSKRAPKIMKFCMESY